MTSQSDAAFDTWARAYREGATDGTVLMWPSETLVRLLRGPYVPGFDRELRGRKALEVGVGSGNNLPLLASLGLLLSGTEVQQEICDAARTKLDRLGVEIDLRVGTNRSLPFDDGEFDILTSWNVIHYESNEDDMRAAIAEYARVLRPGGRCFVSTTGPDHTVLRGAETVGAHQYRLNRDDDFRKGEVVFYFDAPNYIEHYFGESFDDVLVGRSRTELFGEVLDWYIVTAVAPGG